MAKEDTYDAAHESPASVDPQADPDGVKDAEGGEPPNPALEALQLERDDYYDRLLRKTAEFDNYRKRVERDRRAHADEAVESLLLDVLLVADDFDRAVETDATDVAAYRKGVELIHAKLHDLLRKRGVRAIEALGADFDPNVHQAVTHEESPDHREGEVIAELRRGYTMGDRLLRPTMVKVAKA